MKRQIYICKKFLAGMMTVMLALLLGAGVSVVSVEAASGNIYTCNITPCYAHPVTGNIEDSGGSSSYATGQGMVEGAMYTTGMLEVTDSGSYYLTFRIGLMDYTTNHSFTVQNAGDSGWSSTGISVVGTGSDNNGTADVCVQVPSENCVVRCSMYVSPMGRDVIFYFYPSNYSPGNTSGMTATIVTENSSDTISESGSSETGDSGITNNETISNEANSDETVSGGITNSGINSSETTSNETTDNGISSSETVSSGITNNTNGNTTNSTVSNKIASSTSSTGTNGLSSSITKAANPNSDISTDSGLSGAQGLSLSTRVESAKENSGESGGAVGQTIMLTMAITISGLIILAVAAAIVYYYRKNWRRWGGEDDDD